MRKDGLWKDEQHARDLLICQMIWIRTAIYYLAAVIALLALGFALLMRDINPDGAFGLIGVITIIAIFHWFRHQRKADYIEKDYFEQVYD